jgi:hypothetical protein
MGTQKHDKRYLLWLAIRAALAAVAITDPMAKSLGQDILLAISWCGSHLF